MRINLPNGSRIVLNPRITRLSIYPGDFGNKTYLRLGARQSGVKVHLNGREMRNCLVADARAGYVDFAIQRNGAVVLNKFRDGVVIHRAYGEVVITCPPTN
jgi:hypothetical protein